MDKEAFVISKFPSAKIGDDGAVVGEWVYSKDIFAEHTHFKREWMSLEQIARKSMLVNLSDAVAMNAVPKYALIGVIIPNNFSRQDLQILSNSFLKECNKWGVEIIGGDTTSGASLVISITIIAHTTKPIFRHGMKVGDFIAHTGKVGQSLKGLRTLLRSGKLAKNARFIAPTLRSEFFYKAASYVHTSMDLSDGISKDLSRLCHINNMGVHFICKLNQMELCSGEEYEMLFSFPPKNLPKLRWISKKTRTPFRVFARAVRGRYRSFCKEHHFKD
ncbi:MAG: thiamine-phosphate kinase [Campylobacteraceae bacterium]|nr:thiamine-phosphate kinase [Campylobacteraceae bacterium]